LLQLLAGVCREVPAVRLYVVGEEDDTLLGEFGARSTGYVPWLRQFAAELGVAPAVTFLGPRFGEDLAECYAAADVVVNASVYHRENGGLAQAEAQACGIPVVCTAWGGFKDVVRAGESGFFMDAVLTKHGIRVDWAAGAARVIALLHDPQLRARMGARAAAWAREQYGIVAFSRALGRVAAEVLGQTGEPAPAAADHLIYEPSSFARRYEAHKRACGWYVASQGARWYPPMFQGRDYPLYERMMEPYATKLAQKLHPQNIAPEWVPYFAAPVALDPVRHLVEDYDPIWPHRRFCSDNEWAVVRRIDGQTSVRAIAAAERPPLESAAVASVLWRLHLEGFVLFRQQVVRAVASPGL
ncbi:MAG TPA: glycosyltransferase, partial [Chloroflexota bacterium]|nr:glycosyltransferase [Chloroflexota bacterium]